jgi:hypothetical protein
MFTYLNRSLMKKFYLSLTTLSLLVLPAIGQSSITPEYGYEINTWLPDYPNIGAFDFSDTLFYLNDGDTIHMLGVESGTVWKKFGKPEDYRDNFVSFLTLSPDGGTIWTGFTTYGSVDDRIYSIDVESGHWEHQASFPASMDLVFWKDSILVSGLNSASWDAPAAIFILDTTGTNEHRRIIEPGGYSAGMAIDKHNHLYYGTSYAMDPNALYRWHADTIQAVVEDPASAFLQVSDGEKLFDLPGGVYDCEVDKGGNVLFNMNLDGGVQSVCRWNGLSGDGARIDTLATASGEWDWLGNLKSLGDISLTEPWNMIVTYSFGQHLVMLTQINTVGINRPDLPKYTVYPNPCDGIFTVQSEGGGLGELNMYSLQGRLVFSTRDISSGMKIDISRLPAGSYILRIGNSGGYESSMMQKL